MRIFFLPLLLILYLAPAAAQKERAIPLQPDAWDLSTVSAEFTTHLGRRALRIEPNGQDGMTNGLAFLEDITFANGTIDYDVALAPNAGFTSIHFRRRDADNSEHFYLRGFWAGDPKINTAIQYAAVLNGVNLWDLSQEYQSNADLNKEGWNHVRLVVRDRQLLAYVNDMKAPTLYVPVMDGDWTAGRVGFDGNVYLSNVRISPDATTGLAGIGYDPVHNDSRYLRDWQVGTPDNFPFGKEPVATDLPDSTASWSPLAAERYGLVNLSRRFGATPRGERRIVWLKTTLTAAEAQRRELSFGFSDEAYVYLNGRPLFRDKNLYGTPGMKAPRGRASLENTRFDLPLAAGENELLIGVTNFFFGWGIVARLDDAAGIRF